MNEQIRRDGVILYHGTSSVAVEGILTEGLIPKKGQGCDAWSTKVGYFRFASDPRLVFLAAYPERAMQYAQLTSSIAGGCPVIIK